MRRGIILSTTLHLIVFLLFLPSFTAILPPILPPGINLPIPPEVPIPIELVDEPIKQDDIVTAKFEKIAPAITPANTSVQKQDTYKPEIADNKIANNKIAEIQTASVVKAPPIPRLKPDFGCERQILPEVQIDGSGISFAKAALVEQSKGNDKLAITLYEKAILTGDLSDKGLAGVYSNMGASLKNLGLIDKAIQYYDYALKLRPGYDKAIHNKAVVYEKTRSGC